MSFAGWINALISCVAFGSFAVPIKCNSAQKCSIDPLAFQTYKTAVCLLTSVWIPTKMEVLQQESHNQVADTARESASWWWLRRLAVLYYNFTPWGIVSGLFWVPGGVAAIYAVQNAGLALSQGLWSSIIVLVAFTWGVFIFDEHVRSKNVASLAVLVIIAGLCGMSYFSAATTKTPATTEVATVATVATTTETPSSIPTTTTLSYKHKKKNNSTEETAGLLVVAKGDPIRSSEGGVEKQAKALITTKSKRQRMGLMAAVFNGVWGGSVMVPMKFAPPHAKGPGFVFSFAVGATLVTLLLWMARFVYHYYSFRNIQQSFLALPSLHWNVMWKAGGLSGLVWSIGNLSGMIAVHELGVGVGQTLSQASMLISGLWGILYFKEIDSTHRKCNWLISAMLTVAGIGLLSYQHED